MEKISTLFNYILALSVLLYMTNMLAYTMLTLDCKSSYVHLGMLKYGELHCSVNVFKLRIDGISVHSKDNNMNTYMKTVCGVLTANSDFKIYTISMLIYN